jgi:hypothetical protein
VGYVYWPVYDALCHEQGTDAAATLAHLDAIDRMLGRLAREMAGTGTCLLVVADHGLVNTPPRRMINLAELEGFYDCLSTLPAGDARQVSCWVRPSREDAFLDLVRTRLGPACVCITGDDLIAEGVFGPGQPHRSLSVRAGDHVLIAREDYAFASAAAGHSAHKFIGNHGGMGEEEMLVPLYVVR